MTLDEYEKMKFYGYDTKIKRIKPNQDKFELLVYLNILLKDLDLSYQPKEYSTSAIVQSSESFFKDFFTPQNISMVMPENEDAFAHLAKYNKNPNRLRRVVNRFTVKASPFDLPITRYRISGIRSYIIDALGPRKSIFKRFPLPENNGIIYRNICIDESKTITTPFEYTHEITHTQVDSHVGAVGDYYNSEVLSIFMEKLHAFYTSKEDFAIMEKQRIFSLYKILHHFVYSPYTLEDYAYIESTIEAEILFNMFLSSEKIRNHILESIQDIFLGNDTLENLLARLNITSNGLRKYIAIESNLSR